MTRALYLDLIERCLLNTVYEDAYTDWRERRVAQKFDPAMRQLGRDWPSVAHTMIGQARLRNLRDLAEQTLVDKVPGDFIETGVWRGGACILLRAVLQAHGVRDRRVFAADSFEGLPTPNAHAYPADAGDLHHQFAELAISLDQVKANFAKYDLLDDQVVFLKGWFKDTLPSAPIERLAILRLDGDMYESTMDGLRNLYDKVSPGGFVIVDDYGCVPACRQAVEDYRREKGITDPVINIDGWGIYWRKAKETSAVVHGPQPLAPLSASKHRPFWSVIVPVYERRDYLKHCLDSILDQDPGPGEMEIIVLDDASPTDLSCLVASLGRGRVSYVRNEFNRGLYPSTNLAIRQARGRWLHILHDDDWVLPGFYAALRSGIETAPAAVGVAFCMYANWHEREKATWSPAPFRQEAGVMDRDFLVRLAAANPLNLPAVTYRREAFERVGLFREDLPYTADWEWYVRSAVQLAWYHEPRTLACWRVHAANQTHELARAGTAAHDIRKTLEIIAQYLPPDVAAIALPAGREFHSRQMLGTGLACAQAGNLGLVDRLVLEALALDPDGPARPEFVPLLQHPHFTLLRNEVRAALLRRL